MVLQHTYKANNTRRAVWTNRRLESMMWNLRESPSGVVYRSHRHTDSDFSRNISQVLENLLKDYDRSQLPNHGKGG